MQPDLLSPEKEDTVPESLPQEEPAKIESISEKKRSRVHPAYIALGVLVILLLAAMGWVGYWSYNLSNELMSTQQQLATLQTSYDKLQADYNALKGENEKLSADLAKAQADLEKANADLAAAQADLAKSQDQNKSMTTRFEKGTKLAEVLYAFINISGPGDLLKLDTLIKNTKNQELQAEWD